MKRQLPVVLVRRAGCLLALASCSALAWSQAPMYSRRMGPTIAEQYLLRSINAERIAAGLRPVHYNQHLSQAAFAHALEMGRTNTLSHRLQGEPDLSHRGWAAGGTFTRISENVAVGPSILEMHVALMRSEHHRENILDDQVDAVGVSVVAIRGSLWAVEDFSNEEQALATAQR